jgi:hypothetical protein
LAQWLRSDDDVPVNLGLFDPLEWGNDGDRAVDRWKHACLEYLTQHPDKVLPFGEYGDQLSVLREAIRLKGGSCPSRLGQQQLCLGLSDVDAQQLRPATSRQLAARWQPHSRLRRARR